jgi:hypothetical protein
MSISDKKLPTDANAQVLQYLTGDYCKYITAGAKSVPGIRQYVITSSEEPQSITRSARLAALNAVPKKIIKQAFDTRRTDQELERNPRATTQFYHRSDPFITEEVQGRLNLYSKLIKVTADIKNDFEREPEYHESYSRVLHGHLERALRLDINDQDFFEPQLAYINQILFARYRLTDEEIQKASHVELRDRILAKDEALMKRGSYLEHSKLNKTTQVIPQQPVYASAQPNIIIDGGKGQDALASLFNMAGVRREGEKKITRTITISVTDSVD